MITNEISDIFILFSFCVDCRVVAECSVNTLFRLPSHKDRARSAKVIEHLTLGYLDLALDLCLLIPFLCLDGSSTLAEQVDDFAILEGKRGNSNLSVRYILVTKIRELTDTLLHFCGDPCTEALSVGLESLTLSFLRAIPVIFLFGQPVGEELWIDIELDGEIARSDRFHIPFDIEVLLNFRNVVKVVDDEKSDEDGSTTERKRVNFTGLEIFQGDKAADLHEHLG